MTTLVGSAKGTNTGDIVGRLDQYVGQNIDLVGAEMEQIAHDCGFCFRWLEPATAVAEYRDVLCRVRDVLPSRVNVHVDLIHTVTKITLG